MIDIVKEKDLGFPYENCVFCNQGTQYWSVKKDVPVCCHCSINRQEFQVPHKETWVLRGKKTRNSFSRKNQAPSI